MQRKRGSTSNMITVFIQDNTKTDGSGLTGLSSSSTNLQISTRRELDASPTLYTGANIEAQTTIGTYQAPSASTKIRFKEIDATNRKGEYELQFHDSAAGAFGAGDASRLMQIRVDEVTTTALHIAPCLKEVELTAEDLNDAELPANVIQVDGAALGSHHAGYFPTDLYYWRNQQPGAISNVGGYIPAILMRWLTDDSAGTPDALSAGLVQAADSNSAEIIGLLGKNCGFRNTAYSGGNLISYDLCIYDTAGHATTNDGVTGLLHKYSVALTYDGSNNLLTYAMTRIS